MSIRRLTTAIAIVSVALALRSPIAANGNGTRFDYENEFELPGGVLGKAAGKMLSAAPARREARRSLENLKRLLESGA